MNYFSRFLWVMLALILSQPASAQTISPYFEDGNIYIKIKPNVIVNPTQHKNQIGSFPFLADFANTYTVTEFRQLYTFAKHPGLENIFKISIAERHLIQQSIETLSKLEAIEYAEKVPYKKYFSTPPNDTSYNNTLQWNLFKINAQIAWNFIGNAAPSSSIVAIVDDGLDINHIDLKDNLWVNNLEMNGLPGVDDDGNFVIDDSLGYDFGDFDPDASPNDVSWTHGTHVSGIAGAVTNNVTGIASIAYNARLMAVKGSNSNLYVSNGYEAIAYAADNGADVINLSWGAPVESVTEANTIMYAYFLGAVIVAASGNSNDATVNFPAAYPHVISVSSTANNDTKATGTTYGQWIDVSAPGVNILSTAPGNAYAVLSGTSMASPLVAGLAALMKTYNPMLGPDQIKQCIKNNTDNIDFMNPNFIGKLGTGRINAFKAMQCVNATRNQIDASLTKFALPDAYSCVSSFNPKISLKNAGTSNLQSITISYKIDNEPVQMMLWSGDMGYDSLQYIELPAISLTSGQHTLLAYCSNPNGALDWSFLNDTISTTFEILNAGKSLPFSENFDSGFEQQHWKVSNPDNDKSWQIKSGTIDGTANKAAFINMFNYDQIGQRDGLITPPLNFMGYDSISLSFDYAWKMNFRQNPDTLILLASIDCGESFPVRLATFYNDSLNPFATSMDTMDNYFNPLLSSLWCGNVTNCINIDLSALVGNPSVLLKFETYNNFNNNLFIDNVNIVGTSTATAPPANASITASTAAICQGGLITFSANESNNSATQWNWTFSNGTPSSATGQTVTIMFDTPGTVNANLIIGNTNGTINVSLGSSINIDPLPLVNILQNDTAICADNSIILNVTGADTYQWSPFIGLSDTIGNVVTANPQQPITYIVAGISAAGCLNFDTIHIDTTICLGLTTADFDANFKVYYNPSNGFITIHTKDYEFNNHTLNLYNAVGQLIFQSSLTQQAGTQMPLIDCLELSNGFYFTTISGHGMKLKTDKILVYHP